MNSYLVIAYRYGDLKGHNFPVGCFSSEEIAIENAKQHRLYRSFKYEHLIYRLRVNQPYDYDLDAEIVWSSVAGVKKQ